MYNQDKFIDKTCISKIKFMLREIKIKGAKPPLNGRGVLTYEREI